MADVLKDSASATNQSLPSACHIDSFVDSLEEFDSQLLFKQPDFPADRRLGHVKLLSRQRKALIVCNGQKHFKLSKIHGMPLSARSLFLPNRLQTTKNKTQV